MQMLSNEGVDDRAPNPRVCTAVGCMVVVLMASGCGLFRGGVPDSTSSNPSPSEPLPTDLCTPGKCDASKLLLSGICPTGGCDPTNPNGQGIYTVEKGNYCFLADGDQKFCPEAFINTPNKGVSLMFRHLESPLSTRNHAVTAWYRSTPTAPLQETTLIALTGDRTQLTAEYSLNGKTYTATGEDLRKLTFYISAMSDLTASEVGPYYSYEMKITPDKVEKSDKGVYQYTVSYWDSSKSTNKELWHCQPEGPLQTNSVVSFLPHAEVHGLSAFVRRDPQMLTMACKTGAIASCLNWGYTPWDDQTGQWDDNRDYAFRSCMQAKRAAYFVSQGDLKSYTKNGTKIQLRDQYGIMKDKVAYPEAIWSPEGAVCINSANLRQGKDPQIWGSLPADTRGLPECNPLEWSEKGKLATGPQKLPE
jgi:hypothetical protein